MYEVCDRVVQLYFTAEDTSTANDTSATLNTSSPVNKRRGFSGRKWLPPPLRKLSQGKVDKSQAAAAAAAASSVPPPSAPPLKKTGSDKRIKVPSDMGNKPSVSEGEDDDDRPNMSMKGAKSMGLEMSNGGGEDADEELELPPPMKPIQEPILVTSPPPGVPGVPDIEENPCKREQHSENQERHSSMMRDAKSENAISEYSDAAQHQHQTATQHRDLSAQCSSNEATAQALSGDEGDRAFSEDGGQHDRAKKIESLLRKRRYVLKELVDTEEAYVRDLSMIVDGYIALMKDPACEIQMPEDLRDGKDNLVFAHVSKIYEWHKNTFFQKLKKAVENPIELASLFKDFERNLHMYVLFCKNKHVSEYIVSEYLDGYFEELRVKLGHKLQLCDLMIKPVQRLMKYQLMLKDILKYTERAELVDEIKPLRTAFQIMVIAPKTANDMMDIGRLQDFKGDVMKQGKLLYHGILTVSDYAGSAPILGKNKDFHVFFFEQRIIFSEVVGKKTQFTSPKFFCKADIQVNKLALMTEEEEDCFILKSTDPNQCIGFICQAPTASEQNQWLATIQGILDKQRDFVNAIQSPIAYQKEQTKEA